ncbi:hypothetical protein JZL89_21445, partial [Providencia rettgeri]|uniref:hypothetical protein n=1 Tax=Providencia rettgeri TaxID=587 RepID=UPI0019D13684
CPDFVAERFFRLRPSGKRIAERFVKEKTGLAGLGIVTAEAVTLFKSSLRCGASGAKRLPCPYRA